MKKTKLILLLLLTSAVASSGQIVPQRQYAAVKENYRSFKNGQQAYEALIRQADKALAVEIKPVTEKSIIAASGDPHDYVSMGPYWWPDPEKTDGLPYIRRDGERNPESRQLDRTKIDLLLKTVSPLAHAYYFTGNEEYARKAVGNLRTWFLAPETRMNPNFNYAQMIPGHNEGRGRGAGVIDGYSFVAVIESIYMLEKSAAMTDADMAGLRAWFSELTDWLATSEIGLSEKNADNNHGIAYDVQVAAYAMFAGRNDVARDIAGRFPAERIFVQIEPDGSQPRELGRTMAMHYTLYNIEHMLDMAVLAERLGADIYGAVSEDGRSVRKAMDFILPWFGKPQSDFPYAEIGSWEGNQQKMLTLARFITFFEPNTGYDRLFTENYNAPPADIRWLLLGKPENN